MAGGNVAFYTLPVDRFGKNARGEDINVVNLAQIRATVKQLLSPGGAGGGSAGGGGGATTSTGGTKNGPTGPATPVPVTGTKAPPPTALSELAGGGIPCVK